MRIRLGAVALLVVLTGCSNSTSSMTPTASGSTTSSSPAPTNADGTIKLEMTAKMSQILCDDTTATLTVVTQTQLKTPTESFLIATLGCKNSGGTLGAEQIELMHFRNKTWLSIATISPGTENWNTGAGCFADGVTVQCPVFVWPANGDQSKSVDGTLIVTKTAASFKAELKYK